MEARRSKSLYLPENRPPKQPLTAEKRPPGKFAGFQRQEIRPFQWIRQVVLGLYRLFIALKYQVERLLPGSSKLPWLKLSAAFLLVFLVFKRDLQFQINMQSPMEVADRERGGRPAAMSSVPSQAVPQALLLDEKPARSPFLELPSDDAETKAIKAYIRRFAEVAQTEMKKFGIPASIQMAQAILESNAGRARVATQHNNHFGIKCFSKSCNKGHCANFADDHHKDFFRIYGSAWESWRAHSELLSSGKYQPLLQYKKDCQAWATGLQERGYATDQNYATKLLQTVERYQLQTLDR